MSLTAQQQAIIREVSSGTGNLVVDAKAGSGKTSTMVEAINATDPSLSVICVAFNREIANELAARMPEHAECRTTHSLGLSALKKMLGKFPKRNPRKLWECWDTVCGEEAPKDLPRIIGLAKASGLVPKGCKGAPVALCPDSDSWWVNLIDDFNLDFEGYSPEVFRAVLRTSIDLAWAGNIDFDDMLYMPTIMRAAFPQADILVVDEAQDIAPIQRAMFKLCLKRPGARLVAVGDRHQAIYAFRGADHRSLGAIEEEWSARIMPLSVSFRCPRKVVAAAQRYVPGIEPWPNAPEGEVVHLSGWSKENIPHGSAILCRNTKPLVQMCWSLLKLGVGAKIRGRDIGENLKRLVKKTGAKTLEDLGSSLDPYVQQEEIRLLNKGKDGQAALLRDKADAIRVILDRIGWHGPLRRFNDEIDEMFCDDRARPPVMLSTIHKAKGLEWPQVVFLDSHLIPSKYAVTQSQIQQENNLAYVAITRAKERLVYANSEDFDDERKDEDEL